MGARRAREQNTKLAGRWTVRARIGVAAIARLPQLLEADAAVGTERGARRLSHAMGLLAGVLHALGED